MSGSQIKSAQEFGAVDLIDSGVRPLMDARTIAIYPVTNFYFTVEFWDINQVNIPIWDGSGLVPHATLSIAARTPMSLGAVLGSAFPWLWDAERKIADGEPDWIDDGAPVSFLKSIMRMAGGALHVSAGEGRVNTFGLATFNPANDGFDDAYALMPTADSPRVLSFGSTLYFGRTN